MEYWKMLLLSSTTRYNRAAAGVAAGGQAGVAAQTGNSTTSVDVYIEVEKRLNNEH